MTEQPEQLPVHEGADPHEWPEAEHRLWKTMLDVEVLGRVISAMEGPVHPADSRAHTEARMFLEDARQQQRGLLSDLVLGAYRVTLPEEPDDLATEAVGGIRGDGDSPGDRDNVRGV